MLNNFGDCFVHLHDLFSFSGSDIAKPLKVVGNSDGTRLRRTVKEPLNEEQQL